MNAEEFLKKLATATPSRDELKKAGRTAVVIEKLLGSRKCERRKRPLKLPQMSGNESLIELFNGWDTGTLSIGGLDFLDVPIDTPGGLQIGKEEVEPVLIAPNGEIVIEERGTGGHRLADVAENGNSFLNALIIVAKFFGDRGTKKIAYDDYVAAQAAARECAKAAGGDKYLRFYWSRLGADE